MPRSGSAYIYIYVTLGEFIGVIMGWTLILEYIIGVSSGASSLSIDIDSLINNTIQVYLKEKMPMSGHSIAEYPDFLAFVLVMLITCKLQTYSPLFFLFIFSSFLLK